MKAEYWAAIGTIVYMMGTQLVFDLPRDVSMWQGISVVAGYLIGMAARAAERKK